MKIKVCVLLTVITIFGVWGSGNEVSAALAPNTVIIAGGACGSRNAGGPAASVYYGTWRNDDSGNILKMFPGNNQYYFIGEYRSPQGEYRFSFCMNNNPTGPGLKGNAVSSGGTISPLYLNINPAKPNEMYFELTTHGNTKTRGNFRRM